MIPPWVRITRVTQPSTLVLHVWGETRNSPLPLPDQGDLSTVSPTASTNSCTSSREEHTTARPQHPATDCICDRTSTQRCLPER